MKNFNYFLNRVKKEPKYACYIDISKLASELRLSLWDYQDEDNFPELKAYFSPDSNWICTDTWVGLRFYFFNDVCVAISYQPGRKYDEEFEWLSLEAANEVRDFIWKRSQNKVEDVKIIDQNEDWSPLERHP